MRILPRLYDLMMARGEHGRVGRWRRSVVAPARGSVLEIGAGTGLDFSHYRPATWVVATDPDLAMLERARPRARAATATIELVAADAEALPFRYAAFDEAVVGLAMCTIPHPVSALDELRRTIRPDGVLRMLEHVRVDHPAAVGRLQDWIAPLWRLLAGGCHLNRRTVEAVRGAGFERVAITTHLGGYVKEILARNPKKPPGLEHSSSPPASSG